MSQFDKIIVSRTELHHLITGKKVYIKHARIGHVKLTVTNLRKALKGFKQKLTIFVNDKYVIIQ